MDVSVVIINYNTFDLTCQCIESIFKETKGIRYEIILVDNASRECNPDKFLETFSNITLVKSSENIGFSRGNNLGIQYATGKYILLLNSDIKLTNNAVKLAYERMNHDETIGVLSGKLLYPDFRIQPVAGRFPNLKTELFELFRLTKLLSVKQRSYMFLGTQIDYKQEVEADWVWGAFFMFPRDLLEKLPGTKLPDDFFMYAEDLQWCFKVKKIGLKVIYSPEPVCIHYIAGSDKGGEAADSWKRYKDKMLPNIKFVLIQEKGRMYAFFYFLVKALHSFSLRSTVKGKAYLELAFDGIFK